MHRRLPFPRHLTSRGGLGLRNGLPQNSYIFVSSLGVTTPNPSLPAPSSGDVSPGSLGGSFTFTNGIRDTMGQIVHATWAVQTTFNSQTWTNTGLSATITPRSVNSTIMMILAINGGAKTNSNTYGSFRITRNAGATIVATSIAWPYLYNGAADVFSNGTGGSILMDAPATTSPITYQVQAAVAIASTSFVVNTASGGNQSTSTFTLIEIAGG